MTADDRPPLVLVEQLDAYVSERAQRCREILAAGVEALRPARQPEQPLRPRLPGEPRRSCEIFAGWQDPLMLSDLPAMPLDNWSPDRAALREFETHVDELLEWQHGEWLEAAE